MVGPSKFASVALLREAFIAPKASSIPLPQVLVVHWQAPLEPGAQTVEPLGLKNGRLVCFKRVKMLAGVSPGLSVRIMLTVAATRGAAKLVPIFEL